VELTEAELAARSGTTPDRVRRLVELGVVEPDEHGFFSPIDIHRIRIADAFEESGLAVEDLGRLTRAGHVRFPNLETTFREPVPVSQMTFAAAARSAGWDVEVVRRLYGQLGLPVPADDDCLREDDAAVLPRVLAVLDLRFLDVGEEVFALRIARLYGETIRRLTETASALADEVIAPLHDRVSPDQAARLHELGDLRIETATLLAGWLLRRHAEAAIIRTVVENIERTMEETGIGRRRDPQPPAIVFLDLSGFTRLTGARGDEEAAHLSLELSHVVEASLRERRGRSIKSLGDGFMLHFRDPADAVAASLELVETVPDAGLPPARVGISAGPVVFRDGDYFGRTVNLAARIADYARPREVLTAEAVAAAPCDATFEEIGTVELKGIGDPVRLFRALRS
jgi:adenylate cyclase